MIQDAGFLGPVSITIRWNRLSCVLIGQDASLGINLYVMISNELNLLELLETFHGN